MRICILFLLLSLSGCMPDKDLNLAIKEAKKIVDGENSDKSCLIMYKQYQSDNGTIYYSYYDDTPCFDPTGECPTKIIKYKKKFICIIDSDGGSRISRSDAYKLIGISTGDAGTRLWNDSLWYIGVSSNRNKSITLRVNGKDRCSTLPYHYPQLLSYLFNDYNEHHIPRFMFDGYEIVVNDNYQAGDRLNDYVSDITGTFYFSNPQDSFFNLDDCYFAVVYNADTLRFHVKDTIERRLFIDSVSYTSFFKNLPDDKESLSRVLRDSTYLFCNENGKQEKISVPYCSLDSVIYLVNEIGRTKDVIKVK